MNYYFKNIIRGVTQVLEVVILTINPELTQNEFDKLMPLVCSERQERIKQFRFFQDARNCLLGDILARNEICRTTGLGNNQLEFSANAYGKPFLVNSSYVHFNVSHSGRYVACAVANEPVGIDIEIIKPIELKIAERFFTPDEVTYVMNDNYTFRFYEVWTKKESRIKWEGKGLSKPLTSFSVFDSDEQEAITYHKGFQNEEAICHICTTEKTPPSVKVINITSFIRSAMQ